MFPDVCLDNHAKHRVTSFHRINFFYSSPGFPISGVAGMVTTLSHFVKSRTSSSFNPTLSISLLHESFHIVLCLPLRPFPGCGPSNTILSTCLSSVLLICPYHFTRCSVIFCVTGATLTGHHTCSFLISSFIVTLHIDRIIPRSFTSSLFTCLFCVDHASAP